MDIRQTDRHERWGWHWMLAIALMFAGGGCGPERSGLLPTTPTPLVWPEAPEPPRVAYLGAVSTETDMNQRRSLLDGFGELLFGKRPVGILVCPYAVAVDSDGVMYVADSGGAAVHTFNLSTRDYNQFSSLGKDLRLQKPVALAPLADRLYVVDSGLRRVCVFKKNGTFLFSFGQDRFQRPAGIACRLSDGVVYVADAGSHTIHVFGHDGEFLRQIGARGVGPGQFNFPTHLHIDRSDRLYVSDTLNYRIQVFGPDDRLLRMFGQQGDRPGNFAHPCGVAVDRFGNIYVTDRQFENVQVFSPDGQILMAFGQEGTGPGQFWLPAGIFIDGRNHIYVADSYNKRIQVFDLLEDIPR
jgi:DNA-binding beta-propeller fold protein YncE